jgi:hypothetical protein
MLSRALLELKRSVQDSNGSFELCRIIVQFCLGSLAADNADPNAKRA